MKFSFMLIQAPILKQPPDKILANKKARPLINGTGKFLISKNGLLTDATKINILPKTTI